MTQDTKAMVEAFEAKFEADWNDPAMKADTEMWSAAWRAATAAKAAPKCEGDPGECAYNGACMYACGRSEPPKAAPLALAELQRLASACPELNLSNYGPDEAEALNAWALEVTSAIDRLAAAASPPQPVELEEACKALAEWLRIAKRIGRHGFTIEGKSPALYIRFDGEEAAVAYKHIEAILAALAAPPAVEAGQALTESADRVRRLAEDWADDCVKAGYVTTVQCPAYGVMTQAINALAASPQAVGHVVGGRDGMPKFVRADKAWSDSLEGSGVTPIYAGPQASATVETVEQEFDPAIDCDKNHHECEAPEICGRNGRCMGA